MAPLASVSVDLDEVGCYYEIHGLDDARSRDARTVWTVAVPRLLELFERLGVRATFFVVGSSLDPELGAPLAQQIVDAGHEVGNHTESHPYDLIELGPAARMHEVILGEDAIEAATGVKPRGFRAPGYNVDDALLELLADGGYLYDSSVFPCPPYYAAKAVAMAAMGLRGRRSRSLLGPPEVLLAPTEPYRVSRRFHRAGRSGEGLVELPVAVLPYVRIPFIGTTVTLAGPQAATHMARALRRRRFVGFELHGIDVLDAADEGLEVLAAHQPDVRIPLPRKMASLEAAITTLVEDGAELVTSAEAAERLALVL